MDPTDSNGHVPTKPNWTPYVEARVGDTVRRNMAGVEMRFRVTDVTDTLIHCGPWTFDRATGCEVDDDLQWGPPPKSTGSYLD